MDNCATVNMKNSIIFLVLFIATAASGTAFWELENGSDQCDLAIRETILEDRATSIDDTPSRLHSTWYSQECETRTGPEYVIRKYTFYENGTFLLMRHHYAEESCSVGTHTVTARGVLKLQSASLITPGATEAKYHLETVHVVPLNRQVAHKLGHRVNVSCSPQPRWRPYVAQLIYGRPPARFEGQSMWDGPRYNSLQGHSSIRSRRTIDCLEPLGIDFDELRLLRVQKKPSGFRSSAFEVNKRPKVELFLGSLPPDVISRKTHRSTSLQPISLVRADTASGCPICGFISRGTENSPPLLHEVAALPALLGGSWLSARCESHTNGLWRKREIRFFAGDKLWTGRWDYYLEPKCMLFFYSISAAGSYVQRDGRQHRREISKETHSTQESDDDFWSRIKRNTEYESENLPTKQNVFDSVSGISKGKKIEKMTDSKIEENREIVKKWKIAKKNKSHRSRHRRNIEEDDSYRRLLESAQPLMADSLAAILRGNQKKAEPIKKIFPQAPAGTTELDLHVAESVLIPGDNILAARCGSSSSDGREPLTQWPASCIPSSLAAPSTIGLRARIGVDWNGQYTLLLGEREGSLWESPLHQCGPTSMKNPILRSHLRRSVGLRFGLMMSSSNGIVTPISALAMVILQVLVLRAIF